MTKPIIKWAGGKRRIAAEIISHIPYITSKYYEPFLGGAAIFLSKQLNPNKQYVLSDINEELINLYIQVQKDPIRVYERVTEFKVNKEEYLHIRGMDRSQHIADVDPITRAARFIYLNKCGFNGLWRVNSKEQNNVPWGKKPTDFKVISLEALEAVHEKLKLADIRCTDYQNSLSTAKSGDFVYMDPPYIPLNKTSNFTSYTSSGFSNQDQVDLRDICIHLNSNNIKFLQSNSDTPLTRELYKNFSLISIQVPRTISADGSKRSTVGELLIRNY